MPGRVAPVAGSIANAGQFLGQTFLPQTMARMEEMGPAGQMRRQVQGIATNSLMNTGGMAGVAGTGTPATKAYDYTNSAGQSVQIGQDRAAVPLISRETNMGNLRRAVPGAFDAAYLQSQIAQAFPAPVSPVALSEGAILANPVTGAVVASNPKLAAPPAPLTTLAKLRFDLDHGLIDQKTYDAAMKKENYITPAKVEDQFGDAAKLRGEFDTKTKDFAIIRDAASTIQTVANDPSPAGDISLIFSYMKLLDPGSTVREGEYATAQNAASVPESIRAKFNKVIAGETLTPGQRADFVRQANNIYGSKLKGFQSELSRYSDLAVKYNIPPERVVYDRANGMQANMVVKAPQPGTVQDGYRFNGGDPALESNWTKVP